MNMAIVIDRIEPGNSFNSMYFKEHVMMTLREKCRHDARIRGLLKTIIHLDKARPHMSKAHQKFLDQSEFRVASYLQKSQDIAPSDFWMLCNMKSQM
jgi:hypothetical protein